MATEPLLVDLPDELVGDRVIVRPYHVGDGPALFEAVNESCGHILPWLSFGDKHKTVEESELVARRCLARWHSREDLVVSIWNHKTGEFIGGSGLHRIKWEIPSFEIGYWARESACGQGYVSETVRLLCALCFETLGANRVQIDCAAANTRSAAVARRLGFQLDGVLRNALRDAVGGLHDRMVFSLTPEDYAAAAQRWKQEAPGRI